MIRCWRGWEAAAAAAPANKAGAAFKKMIARVVTQAYMVPLVVSKSFDYTNTKKVRTLLNWTVSS